MQAGTISRSHVSKCCNRAITKTATVSIFGKNAINPIVIPGFRRPSEAVVLAFREIDIHNHLRK
jgi:hypothetical protein